MSRQERRAAVAKLKKLPPGPPNISGTAEACGNCKFAAEPARVKAITAILGARELAQGRPAPQAPPDGEVYCLNEPQERPKQVFGWCGRWEAK